MDRSRQAADALGAGLAGLTEWVFPAGLDQGADPVAGAEHDEAMARLEAALKQLSPEQRHLLDRRIAGANYTTTARERGTPEWQVRRAWAELLVQLRRQLGGGGR